MALVRIYQKPAGTPANSSVFAVEIQQNNIWYTKKVSWEDLKGLIAGATSLVFNNGTVTFTTPDGVAHEVLSVDDEVLAASGNPVSGGAVNSALAGKQDTLTFDQTPTDGSTNPVESNGIYDALAGKQDTLTFDTTPTDGSTNPVTSQGIYAAISAVTSGIDWKEAVATYADIATTYPNPEDGWTVTTLDDDHTYRYNGTAWVDLFSLITLATTTKDGLMSSADFSKLAGIEAGANKTIVSDTLTPTTTTKKLATITAGGVAKDINADDTVKVITDLKTPKDATITDGIAQFTTIEANPIKGLKADITPIQDLSHGEPSPTNICPIYGHTQEVISNVGVNQWDEVAEKGTINDTTGQNANDGLNQYTRSKNYVPVFEGETYCFKVASSGKVYYYDAEKTYMSYSSISNGAIKTIPSGCAYIRFWVNYSGAYNNDMSVNYPSTDTNYHEYNGTSVTIDLNGTRYGGTLDVTEGVLTVTDGYIAEYNGETLPSTWISDRDAYAPNTTPTTGAEVVYKLATPTTVTLTPTQITALLGENNVSASTGAVSECKYTELMTSEDIYRLIAG